MLSITFNARFEFQNHYLYLGTLEDLFNLFDENNIYPWDIVILEAGT